MRVKAKRSSDSVQTPSFIVSNCCRHSHALITAGCRSRNPCVLSCHGSGRGKNACDCRRQTNQAAISLAARPWRAIPTAKSSIPALERWLPNPVHAGIIHTLSAADLARLLSASRDPGLLSQPVAAGPHYCRIALSKVRPLYMWRLNPYNLSSAGPGHHAALHRAPRPRSGRLVTAG